MKRAWFTLVLLLSLPAVYGETVRLPAGQSYKLSATGGKRFKLRARIEYPQAAGAAYLLQVTCNKNPLKPLTNKAMNFTYADGRSFPYFRPDGTLNVFYSPDFEQNNASNSGYRVITDPGQAYFYEWKLPGKGKVEVQVRHARIHEGREVSNPLIIELPTN